MYTLIIGVIIFLSLLLILVVLAQNPKGGGLSSQFGGAGVSQVMGVKKTGDLLEKLTWWFFDYHIIIDFIVQSIYRRQSKLYRKSQYRKCSRSSSGI